MTYELAKQLKDAGFRQPDPDAGSNNIFLSQYPQGHARFELVFQPTLSGLIEACGQVEFELNNGELATGDLGYWFARAFTEKRSFHGQGKTPEEAVAKLWLELKKKI